MKFGGMIGASKSEILFHFDRQIIPATVVIDCSQKNASIEFEIRNNGINYPFIIKPDIGERGNKVELIRNENCLYGYLNKNKGKFIVQEYIDYPLELGIMYHRFPGKDSGEISSIVEKRFPTLRGDGNSTIRELLIKHKRARLYLGLFFDVCAKELDHVLCQGEEKRLVFIGNHIRGTTFLNGNKYISKKLSTVIDKISEQQPGFYFGRYDVRARSIEDMEAGRHFKILELNGANSEPAHVYDPEASIFRSYIDLFRHWNSLYKISVANHKRGVPYASLLDFLKTLKTHFQND